MNFSNLDRAFGTFRTRSAEDVIRSCNPRGGDERSKVEKLRCALTANGYEVRTSNGIDLVGRGFAVECKDDLTKTTDLDRLVGQLKRYSPLHPRVYVKIFGDIRRDLLEALKRGCEGLWNVEVVR